MALTYRNVLKNHVVEVPEPADIIAAAEAQAEVLFRKGTKRDRLDGELIVDRAKAQAMQMRQTLTKMDESRRWERHVAPPAAPARDYSPAPAQAPAEAAEEVPAKAAKVTANREGKA